jgi:hypothetical protein
MPRDAGREQMGVEASAAGARERAGLELNPSGLTSV